MLCLGWVVVSAAQAQGPAAATGVPAAAPVAAGIPAGTPGDKTTPPPASQPSATRLTESQLPEVAIERDEPKYVAPTRLDRIGRIWAPVLIDGKGPFRMVLDTGASHSAITQRAANRLGLPLSKDLTLLTGVTGSATVQEVTADRMEVGELLLGPTFLPIVPDVFAGADGVLGREGLAGMRVFADFEHDRLTITRSHNQHAGFDYSVVPLRVTHEGLLMASAMVGRIPVHAIIDTGAERTVGNEALHQAVLRHGDAGARREDIVGVTLDVQTGKNESTPPIYLDRVMLRGVRVTYGDMFLFEHWNMVAEPTLLIGMDVLGSFEALVIDYRTHQLELRSRYAPASARDRPFLPGEYKPF